MSISVVGVGAWSSGVTTGAPNPSYPAVTINAGDLLVYILNVHKAAARTEDVASQGAWTLRAKRTGNAQATAVDTGPCMIAALTKEAVGGETGGTPGEVVITGNTSGTSGTCCAARIFVLRRTAGAYWDVAAVGGTDDVTDTTWSVTFDSDPGIASGDHLVYGNALPTDANPTYASEALAATGATIAAVTDEATLSVAAGLDGGGKNGARAVTAGLGTAIPTWTATLSVATTNAAGPAVLLRAREGSQPLLVTARHQ